MNYIVTFDFGTTSIKCAVLDEEQKIVFYKEKEISTYNDGMFIEQKPNEWYEAFVELSRQFFNEGFKNSNIIGIVFSGHMQDLILVDECGNSISNAILYNDQRGESQLDFISCEQKQSIEIKTGNQLNGSIVLMKLLWIKNNKPEIYKNIFKILISAKDFIITKLTGEFVSDATSLSTSGMMDIKEKIYISEIESLKINSDLMPKICYADEVAGYVSETASKVTGFMVGTKVYVGSGDAGATTLASGISQPGEININLGTSGWVAGISNSIAKNVFNLCAINRNLFINVVPILNAGNVHKWIADVVDGGKFKYEFLHNKIENCETKTKELFFLPYIVGERFPVADPKIRGCYIGINANTTQADFIKATFEGVAFSIKQCLLALNIKPTKISLIGGGAKEKIWNQIFADVLGIDVVVYENSKYLPSIALASIVLLDQNKISSYDDFVTNMINNTKSTIYKVNDNKNKIYNEMYKKFIKIYPAVKCLFD